MFQKPLNLEKFLLIICYKLSINTSLFLSLFQIRTQSMATAKKKTLTNSPSMAKNSVTLHGIAPYQIKSNEEYMNEGQRIHFKLILNGWRKELMEEVDRTVTHMKDEAANFPDPADRATQEEEFSLELRTRDRERKLIKKIDKTLTRVEEDDYGFCDQCGVEIGIRRLEARPTADLCIDCKTLDEIKEKQITGG
jgi:DnaK suppressor protein